MLSFLGISHTVKTVILCHMEYRKAMDSFTFMFRQLLLLLNLYNDAFILMFRELSAYLINEILQMLFYLFILQVLAHTSRLDLVSAFISEILDNM